MVFVLQDADQQRTATRVESTQLAISEVVPVGPLPQIYLTDREPFGSSGVYQTAVHRAMANSVPSPRLTSSASSASSTGSATPDDLEVVRRVFDSTGLRSTLTSSQLSSITPRRNLKVFAKRNAHILRMFKASLGSDDFQWQVAIAQQLTHSLQTL